LFAIGKELASPIWYTIMFESLSNGELLLLKRIDIRYCRSFSRHSKVNYPTITHESGDKCEYLKGWNENRDLL
jgi:hypothetical protein